MSKTDTNAILYKKAKFAEVKRYYTSLHLVPGYNYTQKDKLAEEMYYPSLGIFLLLKRKLPAEDKGVKADEKDASEEKESGLLTLVVNTHILFNKNKGHVKLGMIILLFKIIQKLKTLHKIGTVLLCGDFNMAPNSMLYGLMANGVAHLGVDLKEFSNQTYFMHLSSQRELSDVIRTSDMKYKPRPNPKSTASQIFLQHLNACEVVLPKDPSDLLIRFESSFQQDIKLNVAHMIKVAFEGLSQEIALRSTYAKFNKKFRSRAKGKGEHGDTGLLYWFDPSTNYNESFITNFTEDVKHTVDYVWYASEELTVGGLLQMPDPGYLAEARGAPFDAFPSDHFSLVVDFIEK